MRASIVALVLLASCGSQHRGGPEGPSPRVRTSDEVRGKKLFGRYCYQCHPNGAAGLGPPINSLPLPETAVRTQIRLGAGAMPSFAKLLSDDEIDVIADYVHALRETPARFSQR